MRKFLYLAFFSFMFLADAVSQPETRLLRFPAIHGDQIAFTHAGDLYTVPSVGGIARKITNHVGNEMFARFSHDGKWLAFSGQYDGNTEIYVMPSGGGIPRRLTYTATLGRDEVSDRMGPNNIAMEWTRDDKRVIFRSRMREFNDFKGALYYAFVDGGVPQQLPLPRGGFCSLSPDDSKMAYNRIFREFRTWKRYRGGMTDDIWIYDFAKKTTENITNNPAGDIIPMWSGNSVYFLSDRDSSKRMNLFAFDLATKQTRQLTTFTEFDIKFPSLGDRAIVFENGGFVYTYELATGATKKVPISIEEDFLGSRGSILKVGENVSNYEIAPDGKRALFGARGDVFTVPAKNGPTRNITRTSGIHERNSKWAPDGKNIAFISDATGEDEIYIAPQDGLGTPTRLTSGGDTYKYQIVWSPDGKKIMWSDKKLRLNFIDVESKTSTVVAQATAWEIDNYGWSPDSRWIVYSKPEEEVMNKIYLYSLADKKTIEATDGWYASTQPAFSSDGKFLFFVSNRDFNPLYSSTEWNHAYQDMSRIYFVALSKDVASPFKPKSDEVSVKEEAAKEKKEEKKDEKAADAKAEVKVTVDAEGLKDRIASLPVSVSNYWSLVIVGNSVYYLRRGSDEEKTSMVMYDLSDLKETVLGEVDGFEVSADQKKALIGKDRGYYIVDLPKSKVDLKDKLDLSQMEVKLDRRAEWEQIFNESWRQMRDFFYDPNMHRVDWNGVREKYKPLVAHVNHRADLTYVLGEMIGELSAGHTYVGGGDLPKVPKVQTGLLGAQVEKDAASGYFKIMRILRGQNWDKGYRSPLTEMGVGAREGDFIVEINGISTSGMKDIFEHLVNTVDKQVTMKLNSSAKEEGSRMVTVIPIADEANLYYYRWVEENIRKVNEATQGKVGYIHIPDMGQRGLNEFVKHFYPQVRKKALIVDVRGNGGGNVSPMIIERLRREISMVGIARNTVPSPDPDALIDGPKVCLLDEFSASDGDIFPYRFKKHKLGKLIGKRSWGGVIGIRGTLPIVDGGFINKPEFSRYDDVTGQWIMEGHGVDPDIVVENDPAKEYAGIDQQLDRAIAEILEELKTKEKKLPAVPDYPDKK